MVCLLDDGEDWPSIAAAEITIGRKIQTPYDFLDIFWGQVRSRRDLIVIYRQRAIKPM
jgi:hypothetical protein